MNNYYINTQYMNNFKEKFNEFWLHLIFLISLAGVLGSLYMSEIEKFQPCPFCWWQRIWLYPIVPIAAITIMNKDKFAKFYIFTLSVIGTLFSAYQNLLQLGVFKESEACTVNGTSCATPTIFIELGSLSISLEFMSLCAFILIDVITAVKILIDRKNRITSF